MYLRVQRRAVASRPSGASFRHAAMFLIPGVVSGAPIPVGLGAAQAVTGAQLSIAQMVADAAAQYGVPPSLALGIASHESGFNPNATNLNSNGTTDYGVMQLNTTTVQTLGVANPLDPQQNIDAGVGLLASLLQKYNGDQQLALWAYASGSGSVSAAGSNTANMPAAASSFVNYVTSYTPPASLDLSADAVPQDLTASSGDGSGSLIDLSSLFSGIPSLDPTTMWIAAAAALGLLVFWAAE